MLSTKLSEELSLFIARRQDHEPILQLAEGLRRKSMDLDKTAEGFATSSDKWGAIANNLHHLFLAANETLRGQSISTIVHSSGSLRESIEALPLAGFKARLLQLLQELSDALDEYVDRRDALSGLKLIKAGREFAGCYEAFELLADDVPRTLEPANPLLPGRLLFVVEAELSVDQIVEHLATIARLYRRIAGLAGLTQAESELKVRKIETGSLWMDVLGNEHVIAILLATVSAFAGWAYRRYTHEGRLKSFPDAISSVERALELRKKLQESGFQVESLDAALQEAEAATAADLFKLFGSGERIRLNNISYQREEPIWSDQQPPTDALDSAAIHFKRLPPPEGWGDW